MTQLFINGKMVDIDDSFNIQLAKSFDKTTEHIIEESHYSFEVDIPVTSNNREVFEYVDVFDVANKFKIYDAVLIVDDVEILNGKFIMDEIDSEYYSGNLYVPAKAKLKDVLGDKKLKDIKQHNINIASWSDIASINNGKIYNVASADTHVVFPYILYRLPYNNADSSYPITTQDLSASGNNFSTENIFPAYNVLSILKDCFEGEGYKLTGNIFSQDKFKELYQTFSASWNDYHQSKNTPYYVSFTADYNLRKDNNTSSTALLSDLFSDPSMRVGTDAILLSENTTITNEVDDYNMLALGKNSNAHSLIIPKSGWYRMKCNGSMSYPVNGGTYGQDERIRVTGLYNDSDSTDLSQNIFEFQIKKTLQPMSNVQFYSFNMATPMIPTNLSKSNVHITPVYQALPNFGWVGVNIGYDDARNKFAKNGKTALVNDYSGFDTSEFIAGTRLGAGYYAEGYDDSRLYDRRSNEMVFTCLPDPSKATMNMTTDDGGIEHLYMDMYNSTNFKQDSPSLRKDFGWQTAQVLVRGDSYSNFEGYNKFTPNTNVSGGTWDTTTNFGHKTYPGLSNNSALASNKTSGNWNIDTVVWLEEGDMISFELLMPFNNCCDKCSWYETCDWKNRYKNGVTITKVNFNFEMGIINSDEDWVPTASNPVPSFIDIKTAKPTNVNQWLGDTKVNDYIENFLNTFNLRLTRINNSTYSIDTLANEQQTEANIIDIDEWANVKDASFKRIDSTSTKFEWTISTDEEGYQKGNDTRVDKTSRDESGYTGGITFEVDDTSAKEEKIKSNWSYTWEKDITFVNGDNAFSGGTKEVPVIGDAEMWENNYLSIVDEDYQTDKTSRLIYLDKNATTKFYNFLNVVKYRNDTTIPEVKAPLIFCKNYITYKNILGGFTTFRLDFDNSFSTKNDKTITDIFFNIKKGYQYGVEIPVTLPNDIYHKIKSNTLVKFNDGLFRVTDIEGHDVNMAKEATLRLISL